MPSHLLRSLALFSGFTLLAAPAPDLAGRFYEAIRNDDTGTIAKLLKDRSPNEVRDKSETTPLMYSAAVGSMESMKMLVAAGADVNAKNAFDVTALLFCAADEAKVRFLLSKGADVNARSKQGRTALVIAAASAGSSRVLQLLFAAGADLGKADASPVDTPLTAAVNARDNAAVRLLMEKGANVSGPAGGMALMSAAGSGNLEVARILLKAGVPADRPSPPVLAGAVKNGDIALGLLTPLHLAVTGGNVEVVRLLLDSGASVNRQDVRGMTPLMLAIGCDHAKATMVTLLRARGADAVIQSKAGETPVDWARKFNNPEILAALQVKGVAVPEVSFTKALPVGEALQKSADLLQRNSATFFREGGCASCHSHNLVSIALERARGAGGWTEQAPASAARLGQNKFFWSSQQQALMLRLDPPGGSDMIAYAALQLAADQMKPDATTDAMVHNLAAQQQLDGGWRNGGVVRPPMAESAVTSTALAVRTLAIFATAGRGAEMAARKERAVEWLKKADASTAEERNMQLLGLVWGGAGMSVTGPFAKKIQALQRTDGGWAQTSFLGSDAYATGQSLAALEGAGVAADDAAYTRGVQFLLRTQRPDGSWHVASRAPKFQPYFQSGFPYDHDQWISMAATAWATMGLAHAVPGKAVGLIMLKPIAYARIFPEAVFN